MYVTESAYDKLTFPHPYCIVNCEITKAITFFLYFVFFLILDTYCPLTPPPLSNGVYEVNAEGTNATYRCNQFYQLSTGNDREYVPCLAHQQWQTPTFTCTLNGNYTG